MDPFSHELLEAGWFGGVLRDDYWVEDLVEHNTVSLLIQREGGFYWAVKNEYLSEDDQQVTGYLLDDEGGLDDSFTENGIEAATLTDFVFCHANGCSHGHGGGFRVEVPVSEVQEKLDVTFGRSSGFGDFRVHEAPKLFTILRPSTREDNLTYLHVEVWKTKAVDTIPKFLPDYAKGSGMFHGVFADHL
ncbi:MAG: hypothetical protein K1Y36_26535 [Blastocatellia bacterium]|nr:hypothetical protein [Blastocatellia bacterium]